MRKDLDLAGPPRIQNKITVLGKRVSKRDLGLAGG